MASITLSIIQASARDPFSGTIFSCRRGSRLPSHTHPSQPAMAHTHPALRPTPSALSFKCRSTSSLTLIPSVPSQSLPSFVPFPSDLEAGPGDKVIGLGIFTTPSPDTQKSIGRGKIRPPSLLSARPSLASIRSARTLSSLPPPQSPLPPLPAYFPSRVPKPLSNPRVRPRTSAASLGGWNGHGGDSATRAVHPPRSTVRLVPASRSVSASAVATATATAITMTTAVDTATTGTSGGKGRWTWHWTKLRDGRKSYRTASGMTQGQGQGRGQCYAPLTAQNLEAWKSMSSVASANTLGSRYSRSISGDGKEVEVRSQSRSAGEAESVPELCGGGDGLLRPGLESRSASSESTDSAASGGTVRRSPLGVMRRMEEPEVLVWHGCEEVEVKPLCVRKVRSTLS